MAVAMKKQIAFVLGAFLLGGTLGAAVARRPSKVTETSKTSSASSVAYDMRADWAESFNFTQHTPPKETIRWYRKYVPGAKPGECKIAEEGGELEKVGPGVITGEVKSSGNVAAKGEEKKATATETSKTTEHETPKWALAALVGTDTKLELQAMATVTYKFDEIPVLHISPTLNAAAAAPVSDLLDGALFVGAGAMF